MPAQPILYCVNVYNTRKLIELPFHLIKSQRYQVFRDVIACSYEFLYAKCKTLGIAEVVNDLKLCTVAMDAEGYLGTEVYEDIKSVYDVLMLGVSVIRKDPNHLPVQVCLTGQTLKNVRYERNLCRGRLSRVQIKVCFKIDIFPYWLNIFFINLYDRRP